MNIASQLFRENRVLDILSQKCALYIEPTIVRSTWTAMSEENYEFNDGSKLRIVIDKDGNRMFASLETNDY